jgi:hypothetical protein
MFLKILCKSKHFNCESARKTALFRFLGRNSDILRIISGGEDDPCDSFLSRGNAGYRD